MREIKGFLQGWLPLSSANDFITLTALILWANRPGNETIRPVSWRGNPDGKLDPYLGGATRMVCEIWEFLCSPIFLATGVAAMARSFFSLPFKKQI
ncbi:hypothetical protein ACJIZ3_020645 [Penstemon smallii]|uniref:Uncharacterized protein n=1 Tax=Penstemon smallii TaxID=265156 RepID=A0ABD3SJ72_9LAMI